MIPDADRQIPRASASCMNHVAAARGCANPKPVVPTAATASATQAPRPQAATISRSVE